MLCYVSKVMTSAENGINNHLQC